MFSPRIIPTGLISFSVHNRQAVRTQVMQLKDQPQQHSRHQLSHYIFYAQYYT